MVMTAARLSRNALAPCPSLYVKGTTLPAACVHTLRTFELSQSRRFHHLQSTAPCWQGRGSSADPGHCLSGSRACLCSRRDTGWKFVGKFCFFHWSSKLRICPQKSTHVLYQHLSEWAMVRRRPLLCSSAACCTVCCCCGYQQRVAAWLSLW
ncbi:hypothetical protein DL89DRAFT_70103 [Linderina pennispora]|uniref:Uncharacterized protein n=1 Tax=Linderina pennispora TaxID=61395 RepID=A0A1Y1VYJ6_9FUNG|nr:uncharacterized protein DL89DRAFT_70103 [Linderina pennispora]ORX66340.1 hypothetical protein DL89DRAFT_70103 [Linderina pennispora]